MCCWSSDQKIIWPLIKPTTEHQQSHLIFSLSSVRQTQLDCSLHFIFPTMSPLYPLPWFPVPSSFPLLNKVIKVVNLLWQQIKLSICYVISREDLTHTLAHIHTFPARKYEQEIRTHFKFISRKNGSHTHKDKEHTHKHTVTHTVLELICSMR